MHKADICSIQPPVICCFCLMINFSINLSYAYTEGSSATI